VQAVANQTAARDPEHFVACLTERIQALAANQDLLVRHEWRGIDLEDLVRAPLAHFADCLESRISLHGTTLHLNAAQSKRANIVGSSWDRDGSTICEMIISAAKALRTSTEKLAITCGGVHSAWK